MASKTLRVETVAQAYLELLRDRGTDCFFANAGTDFASIVDAFARLAAEGKGTPRPIAVPHEFLAVSMAHGYYLVTGRPQAVMVHVTVGTANGAGAVINAARTQVPILFSAGRTPITEEGGLAGARDTHIHWAQEAFDQGGMLREYVKWDYELRQPVQLEAVVDRALELAMAEPRGPVYLTLPREVLAQPLTELTISSPARRQVGSRRFPDPARIEEAAERLASARTPLIVTAELGRSPQAVAGLVDLADAGAIPVLEASPAYVNFPADHACHAGWVFGSQDYPGLAEADAVLVIDCDVPWFPSRTRPADAAAVIQLAVDPFYSRYPMRSYPCDVPIAAEPAAALPVLADAVRRRVDRATVAARQAQLAEAHRTRREAWARAALAEAGRTPIGFQWASRCVGEVLDPDTIVVNEYPLDLRHAPPTGPGAYFGSPHSGGLGWALGAALGAKLGAPDKTVIATVGDGAYVFGGPTAAHLAAQLHRLPFLTVIFNNAAWEAVERATRSVHPDGWAATTGSFPLSGLSAAARYEEIVRGFGGHGERVEDPAELPGALRRALRTVREEGRQAVLNVICRRQPGSPKG
ncbi:MAG TPA: thiamine pyrophosphate-requiring protein [Methylomirabilota bacterium]|jgi:acetolactate synthase-1/2/3 large subunit|nr:thiamine pyrophosphate-requiring protein [Methylomirabilota bacterium]